MCGAVEQPLSCLPPPVVEVCRGWYQSCFCGYGWPGWIVVSLILGAISAYYAVRSHSRVIRVLSMFSVLFHILAILFRLARC